MLFEYEILYEKDFKNHVRNKSKGYNVLITTGIDYDHIIYYNAVNDVRKMKKPIFLHGYHRGALYLESTGKYYGFYNNFNNQGAMPIFESIIASLNKFNDSYTIYDLGNHCFIKDNFTKSYKKFGLKELNYDYAFFDSGDPKFIYKAKLFFY